MAKKISFYTGISFLFALIEFCKPFLLMSCILFSHVWYYILLSFILILFFHLIFKVHILYNFKSILIQKKSFFPRKRYKKCLILIMYYLEMVSFPLNGTVSIMWTLFVQLYKLYLLPCGSTWIISELPPWRKCFLPLRGDSSTHWCEWS